MLRHLILSLAVLTNTSFVQNSGLSSPEFDYSQRLLARTSLDQNARPNTSGFDSTYKLTLRNAVQDKNFYLLSLFQRHPEIRKLLRENRTLKRLANDRVRNLRMAANCNNVDCFDRLFRFSGPTIETVAAELKASGRHPEFKKLARTDLRPSGVFIKYNHQSDSEMIAAAWKDAANGMNRLLRIYCVGKDPFYKNIDKVSFDVSSEEYGKLLKAKIAEIKLSRDPLFFEPTLNFGLKLLEVNRRDEAGRYEPLEEGENKTCLQEMKNIRWNDYPYSFILVLGSGPPDSVRLSKIGSQKIGPGCPTISRTQSPNNYLVGWPRSSDTDTF